MRPIKIILFKIILLPSIATFIFSITGCSSFSPQLLGISNQAWINYSKEKQQQLLNNYKIIATQNALEDHAKKTITTNNYLTLKIYNGYAKLPPFTDWVAYKPAILSVAYDSCNETPLLPKTSTKTKMKYQARLRVCYKGKTLFFDPSRYDLNKKNGSITFTHFPLWRQGFTYRGINSSGYVKLRNANVTIKENSDYNYKNRS